ncbi:MAG: CRISPR-associated helicase Cas3' [Hyphomicrobiales bacterium]|nr:MAG: CRISPR-associated helicase Cas3' [Hyphomicrobiales bacterium]
MWYAHSLLNSPKSKWQPLAEHLLSTAALASQRAEKFGAARAANLAGSLHDLGKYTREFQKRLEGGARVDHATAGAHEAISLAQHPEDKLVAEIVAHAIAGHHVGLPDSVGGDASLGERVKRKLAPLDPVWRDEIAPLAEGLIPKSFRAGAHKDRLPYQLAFFGRMIFSCLVDADFRDTERFYDTAEGRESPRDWAGLPSIVATLVARFNAHTTRMSACSVESEVNALRTEILAHVRRQAAAERGLFTLTVPTGGGKTLASLAFALDHAKRHGLERIVYAIPFTSIIDQTAAIFREVLEESGDEFILEHHSSIDEESIDDEDCKHRREARNKLKLAMEDWAAPIVITTNVQLFESLYANRPSRCRRLHNLANSVIILDEAQTIPLHVLRPCLAALDELANNYGASLVLCTATQPAVTEPHFVGGLSLSSQRELAPSPVILHEKLRRVRLAHLGALDDNALVAELAETSQGLMIVNSRAHALALYRKARNAGLEGATHLTTRQYAAHRREILADVRKRLIGGAPCRLIATSLVEAGVDLDFPRVWRAEAGLDQIAQAAGRCNREGKRSVEESVVGVFKSADYAPPREIAQLAGDMARIIGKHVDLLAPGAMRDYFSEVYWRKDKALDKHRVMDAWAVSAGRPIFDYARIGRDFRMIESGQLPVIVGIESPAKDALAALRGGKPPGAVARAIQPYIVQIPSKARELLLRNGHVAFVEEFGDQFAVLRSDGLYKRDPGGEDLGLLWEQADYLDESII